MEKPLVIGALAALAQETRLDVFRALVQAGPEGLSPGVIASTLGIPSATLSFHLKELKNARLARSERRGRSLLYRADFAAMGEVLAYLTENCCRAGSASAREPACDDS
jgi:DNA-binding transcriptional ArsR family regulator